MANKKDPAGQFNINEITGVEKAFGDVPATFGTLIDLGILYIYTHLLIVNSLDEDIVIKFGDNEIIFTAGKDIWFDGFRYNGIIEYKYKTGATASGALKIICY